MNIHEYQKNIFIYAHIFIRIFKIFIRFKYLNNDKEKKRFCKQQNLFQRKNLKHIYKSKKLG